MNLHERLDKDLKSALKEGNGVKLSVLRMAISEVKTLEIEKNVKALDEKDILQIMQRQAKQHRESIEQFNKGNRQDLVNKETEELKILESYLPKQLSDEELTMIIKDAIKETGSSMKADTGKVMKIVMEKVKGRCDGKAVNRLLAPLLK